MTVGELSHRMTAREFNDWYVIWSMEGFTNDRIDLVGGIIASAITNSLRGKGPATKPQDYIMDWDKPPRGKQQSQNDLRASVAGLKAMIGRRQRK